ncbi:uncharacterized protein TNCV_2840911 [Trichonephila clavipes]|uniref:Uncharacterized protein n=1 Tax=Trichonephila clavipes TaxID=2585209 RepID=A0A8X6UYE2_TRICX|nr:uncharacterized protein TNCV_2840911 [Trichonephila clavipes]
MATDTLPPTGSFNFVALRFELKLAEDNRITLVLTGLTELKPKIKKNTVGDRLTNKSVNEHFHARFLCSDNEHLNRNVSPSEQEEDERGPMSTSAIKDLFKKWEYVRAMVLEWNPYQADVSRIGDLYNDNAINYFRKILKKIEKQSTLDMFFNAP